MCYRKFKSLTKIKFNEDWSGVWDLVLWKLANYKWNAKFEFRDGEGPCEMHIYICSIWAYPNFKLRDILIKIVVFIFIPYTT